MIDFICVKFVKHWILADKNVGVD